LHTFIYGNEVEDYEISILKTAYGIEGLDYEIVGELKNEEYEGLIKCLTESKSVRRKKITLNDR
jgi:hypothetical protein